MAGRNDRKTAYFTKINALLDQYSKLMVVHADNVGSRQMQKIRIALRGKGQLLMGKNTMMRKSIRSKLEANPDLEKLLPFVVQNIGFIFTDGELTEIRDIVKAHRVGAPAKAGAIAPVDVILPKMITTLGPEKTSFFQALSIPTKITRGTIEILSDVQVITEGEKVGASDAAVLGMLNIEPFHYGLVMMQIYDNGALYAPAVLDITSEDILSDFQSAVTEIASVSLAIGHPTLASAPHMLINAYKDVLAVCLAMEDYTFPMAASLKALLSDPEALAAAQAASAAAAPAGDAAAGGAAPAKEAAKEESSDDDMGFGLFD